MNKNKSTDFEFNYEPKEAKWRRRILAFVFIILLGAWLSAFAASKQTELEIGLVRISKDINRLTEEREERLNAYKVVQCELAQLKLDAGETIQDKTASICSLGFDTKEQRPSLKNGNKKQNKILKKAWEISKSKEFLYTILGENIELTHDLKHVKGYDMCWDWKSWRNKRPPNQKASIPKCQNNEEGWFWRTHYDNGICGISNGYYKWITDDSRFQDWEWQLGKCWELYKGGTRFYGEANSWYTKTLITWN